VSGTTIQNSLQDVYALVKFLRHELWCETGLWKAAITNAAVEVRNDDPKSSTSSQAADNGTSQNQDNAGMSLLSVV